MSDTIFVIDATNLLHVDYHGMGAQGTAAMFFYRVEAIRSTFKPVAVFAAFDRSPTFRHEIFPEYKANRKPKPDDLIELLANVERDCPTEGVSVLAVDTFESDDILATVAAKWKGRTVLCSTDKDLHQCLVAKKVVIAKKLYVVDGIVRPEFFNVDDMTAKWGFGPDRWIDYQCLAGDSGDNLTKMSATGIGDLTAKALIADHASLDEILANPKDCKISPTRQAGLAIFKHRVELMLSLVTLRTDVPLPIDWETGGVILHTLERSGT